MRGHDDVFVLQLRVATRKHAGYVGGFHFGGLDGGFGAQRDRKRKSRQRLILLRQFDDFVERVFRAFEELGCATPRESHSDLFTGGFTERFIGQYDSRLRGSIAASAASTGSATPACARGIAPAARIAASCRGIFGSRS